MHTPRQRFWVTTAIMLTGFLLVTGANAYTVHSIFQNWSILSMARRDSDISEKKREEVTSSARSLATLAREHTLVAQAFVDPSNPLLFIEAVERLGRRFSLEANLAASGSNGSKPDRYDVAVEGSFPSVYAFLQSLERIPFVVEFGDLTITRIGGGAAVGSSSSGTSGAREVRLEITIRTIAI